MTSFLSRTSRVLTRLSPQAIRVQPLSTSTTRMAATLNSDTISNITEAETKLTGKDQPIEGGPTAQAQKNAGQPLNRQTISDITEGEKKIVGDHPAKGGPTATAHSILTKEGSTNNNQASNNQSSPATGKLDSETISKITDAEKKITGSDEPAKGGPTAKAQSHARESINSQTLGDITAGEKVITGGERVKGGPTSIAQSELAKSQQ